MNTHKNLSTYQALKLWFIAALLCISLPAQASDDYYDYIADLYLHESHQARAHLTTIRYSDGDNGMLLRSVLNPGRFTPALSQYFKFLRRGTAVPDLPQLLTPLLRRYEAAFNNQPTIFEAEYLDSLEAAFTVLTGSSATITDINEASSSPNAQPGSEQKALREASQKINKMALDMGATLRRAMAESIRKKVADNVFSEDGAKRALAIAEKIASQ